MDRADRVDRNRLAAVRRVQAPGTGTRTLNRATRLERRARVEIRAVTLAERLDRKVDHRVVQVEVVQEAPVDPAVHPADQVEVASVISR